MKMLGDLLGRIGGWLLKRVGLRARQDAAGRPVPVSR
jgi:hypothetical protein